MRRLIPILLFASVITSPESRAASEVRGWECQFSEKGKLNASWQPAPKGSECSKGRGPGFIFYRTKLHVDSSPATDLGIYLDSIGDADEVYLSGKLIGKTGEFPPRYLNTMHRPRMYHLGSSDLVNGSELLVKVYSEFPIYRGIRTQKAELGPFHEMSKRLFWEDFKLTTCLPLILILFILTTVFMLFVWIQRPKESYHFWASITAFFMACYTFFLSRYSYELNISNFLNYRGIVGSVMLVTAGLALFSVSFVRTRLTSFIKIFAIMNFLYFLYVQSLGSILEFRAAYQPWYVLYLSTITLIVAHFILSLRTSPKARILTVGMGVIMLTSLNDISISLGLRSGANFSQYGFGVFAIAFILTEAYTLFLEVKEKALCEGELKTQEAVSQAIIKTSAQLAHDIRSPLTALDLAVEEMSELPEDSRVLVRSSVHRIRDIANNLLTMGAETKISSEPEDHLLSSLIESITHEKRVKEKHRPGIEIEAVLNCASYGLFSRLSAAPFKRALSNIIDNATQAIDDKGRVLISLSKAGSMAAVQIKDDGRGIPKEVLPRLTERGLSLGKVGGSGLGLSSAREFVEALSGTLEIRSELGLGTIVELKIPLSPAPAWFVPEILISKTTTVCVLDDDPSIHEVWRERFEKVAETTGTRLPITDFLEAKKFEAWFKTRQISANTLFLFDFELLNQNTDGLTLIEKHGVPPSQTILVTSRFEDAEIRKRCESLGIRLIPKGLAGFVPIRAVDFTGSESRNVVLIDDDPLMHETWQRSALRRNVMLSVFASVKDFLRSAGRINKESLVYIDSHLGDDKEPGEIAAKSLFDRGFKNIWVTTGHPSSRIEKFFWLQGVIGKRPPWA